MPAEAKERKRKGLLPPAEEPAPPAALKKSKRKGNPPPDQPLSAAPPPEGEAAAAPQAEGKTKKRRRNRKSKRKQEEFHSPVSTPSKLPGMRGGEGGAAAAAAAEGPPGAAAEERGEATTSTTGASPPGGANAAAGAAAVRGGQAAAGGGQAAPLVGPLLGPVRCEEYALNWSDILSDGEGSGKKRKKGGKDGKASTAPKRKRLSARTKRNAILDAVAAAEAAKGNQGSAGGQQQQQRRPSPSPPPPQQDVSAAAAAASPPPGDVCNLGKAWARPDLVQLARLSEDRDFLLQLIPAHPPVGELDWELISRHFGRWSKGGSAVRHQLLEVERVAKGARHEAKHGMTYIQLVTKALAQMPDRRGSVLEIQKVLSQRFSRYLDKYKVAGKAVRWKKAVGEVLRDQGDLFAQVGKTAGGKIVWELREGAQDSV